MKYLALGLVAIGLCLPSSADAGRQRSVTVVRRGLFAPRQNVVRQRVVVPPQAVIVTPHAPLRVERVEFLDSGCLGGACQQSLRVQRFHQWGF